MSVMSTTLVCLTSLTCSSNSTSSISTAASFLVKSNPTERIENTKKFIKKNESEALKTEFCTINKLIYSNPKNRPTFCTARFFLNGSKNRYGNILAPDHSRVKVPGETDPCNYINANYIRGYGGNKRAYISAQAPINNIRANTFGDWWAMIFEEKIVLIMMLTKLIEKGKKKADRYWPKTVGDTETYGHIEVTLMNETQTLQDITIRQLGIKNKDSGETRLVNQVHYTGWPDFGTPSSADGFIELIDRMNRAEANGSPILVHCSAGVGRSGTLISCHIAWNQLNAEGFNAGVDVKDIVKGIRLDRMGMVQCLSQYRYIFQVVTCMREKLREPEEVPMDCESTNRGEVLWNSSMSSSSFL